MGKKTLKPETKTINIFTLTILSAENCIKMKEFGPRGESLAPPRSANDYGDFTVTGKLRSPLADPREVLHFHVVFDKNLAK